MSHTLYKCLFYCMSPASQGPHSFRGCSAHRRTRSRTSTSHEVSSTVLSHVISHGCSCYILICQAWKLFVFLNQSVEPIFGSVGVLKLFNSALAVLVSDSLVQHHFSTLQCDSASVCLPLADGQHCKTLQLSVHPVILCQSFPPIWQDPAYSVRIFHPHEE